MSNQDKLYKNFKPIANKGVKNFSYNLTSFNSCSSSKTTDSEKTVRIFYFYYVKVNFWLFLIQFLQEYLAQINSKFRNEYSGNDHTETDMSMDSQASAVSPISTVKPTAFNPFSAARVNGIYGLAFAKNPNNSKNNVNVRKV